MRNNASCLQNGTYRIVGQMVATVVAQKGPLPSLFDGSAVNYILSLSGMANVSHEDLPDGEGRLIEEVGDLHFQTLK